MYDLEGITVVSVEQAVAAPNASGRIVQAEACTIKVARTEGGFARCCDTLANVETARPNNVPKLDQHDKITKVEFS